MRVLIVKTSSMGDVIHTLPAITDLSREKQDVKIDWCVEQGFAEIPTWHPHVNRVIPLAWRRWRKQLWRAWKSRELQRFYQQLTAQNYDVIIDGQGLLKSAVLAKLAQGRSHGYDTTSAREKFAAYFYDETHTVATDQHAITRLRTLFAKTMDYPLPDTVPDYGFSDSQDGISTSPYVVLIHVTSRQDKTWPVEHWVTIAKSLAELGYQVLLPWGNAAEKQRAESIVVQAGAGQVLAKLSLTELKNTLAHASGAVAVDTGLAHLAAAVGAPTVTLYANTDPKRIGTLGNNQAHADMNESSVQSVIAQLNDLMENFAGMNSPTTQVIPAKR